MWLTFAYAKEAHGVGGRSNGGYSYVALFYRN
jgi:hypothetical protein